MGRSDAGALSQRLLADHSQIDGLILIDTVDLCAGLYCHPIGIGLEASGLSLTHGLLSLGGKGVISVVSNVKPELVHNCCKAWFDGDTAKARELQLEMLPLCDALFCEVNPIPVKYAMNVLGWNAGACRLPLVEPSDAHKEKIEQALAAEGLLK